MGKIILTETPLALETRRKSAIDNHMSRRPPYAGEYAEQKDRERRHPTAVRRRVGPCNTYNCHGLTFAARRTAIRVGIDQIILDDDYQEISRANVLPGDLVIYYATTAFTGLVVNEIEHSGIVIAKDPGPLGAIRVLSKWGFGDEWVHFVNDCPYDSSHVKYYRINDCPSAC